MNMLLDDYILNDIDTLEEIDTSEVNMNSLSEDETEFDFWNTFEGIDSVELDDYNNLRTLTIQKESINSEDIEETQEHEHISHNNTSQISFKGWYGRCHHSGCLCKQYEGKYGAVCENCYHGFDKHY